MTDSNHFDEENTPVGELEPQPQHEHFTSLKRAISRATSTSIPDRPSELPKREYKSHKHKSSGDSLHIEIPQLPQPTVIALSALQYLPTPVLVLSSLKTVVLANEAMGRLLGLRKNPNEYDTEPETVTDVLKGQTLSQIGVDLISDGIPVWVSWEKFLDKLAFGLDNAELGISDELPLIQSGETTPIAAPSSLLSQPDEHQPRGRSPNRESTTMQDTVVDVVISSSHLNHRDRHHHNKQHKPRSPGIQATCRMIISIWNLEQQRFFTLTFTSPTPHSSRTTHTSHPHMLPRAPSNASSRSSHSSHSRTPTSSTSNSVVHSPSEVSQSATSFPPSGPPSKCPPPSTYTDFQKVTRMKDAMLQAMHIPVLAMWKDESVVFPNSAARRLLAVNPDPTSDESYDFMSRFKPWSSDFSRQLEESDNPIVALCRTQKAFTRWQIGLINERTEKRSIFDVSGHPVFDDKTGEFFAGLIAFKDVTEYTEMIATQSAENEEQFKVICDMMPQMLWTTRPDGYHDYFSQRWYDYTGLTPANSLGLGWKLPFHDDDMPETGKRWAHSLATGNEYLTEYRCRRYDGEWRWMLGRALPLRDHKTGKILKWFGTCTDIQDIVDARNNGERARQQLLDVLEHSQMYMWIVDHEERVTFYEGHTIEGVTSEQMKKNVVGLNVYDVLRSETDTAFVKKLIAGMRRILDGKSQLELYENEKDNRWFRTRLVPLLGKRGANGVMDEEHIAGVIGIGTEVTDVRRKEQENIKLLANEAAAKEASKMKSNFLANMSHEIRTPIAGVLGMSELLLDTILDHEQIDFAQNIQRSANSLLTVINDILDFSKIESGRLDIEEVQFSLGVVLRDVAKMLSYAAQRKHLQFDSDLQLGESDELVLLGDPGRIRQILTNLLTNSIKFTSDGFVKLMAKVVSNTNDTTTVEFVVQDTGIGIEEEVKKRLFKPFSQADSSTARRFGGTGLGLTISKNLVDLMHGTIRLDSKLDMGTTATFRIPFKKPEYQAGISTPLIEVGVLPDRLQSELSLSCNTSSTAEGKIGRRVTPPLQSPKRRLSMKAPCMPPNTNHPAAEVTAEAKPSRENVHILVVEDNPVNQQIAIKFLKSLKFSASAVWNGKEALEYLLKATSPTLPSHEAEDYRLPTLILMDVQMPVLDGYHATHLLRHHAPYTSIDAIRRIPIIAMTASAIQGDKEKCEKAGMDDYLAKPVKRPVLEKMIMKWIENSQQARRASLAAPDGSKPLLNRSTTEHSSNCPESDYIAAEFLSSRPGAFDHCQPFNGHADPLVGSPVPTDRPHPGLEARRRSSLSRPYIPGIANIESEGERSMRRAEAEEKARSLRDAKLLSATEDDHVLNPPSAQLAGHHLEGSGNYSVTTSPLPQSYHIRRETERENGIMALTEENVEKFNSQDSNYHGGDKALNPNLHAEMHRTSGTRGSNLPPHIDITLASNGHLSHPSNWTDAEDTHVDYTGIKKRGDLGGLKESARTRSDWSISTAKPGEIKHDQI